MKYILTLTLCLLSLQPALSQTETLSLSDCMSRAAQANPQLRISEAEVDKSRVLKGTAFNAPNTDVELTQSATEGGGMENGLRFSQDFEFPTVYVARNRVLEAGRNLAQAEYERDLNLLRGDVATAYYELLYSKNLIEILRQNLPLYQEFARIANARFEEGESSRLESINASRMLSQLELNLNSADLDCQNAFLRLGSLMAADYSFEIADKELSAIDAPAEITEFTAAASHESKVAMSEVNRAQQQVFLSKQEFMPGISVSATSQLLIKGFNPYHLERERFTKGDFMGFSVGINVPLFFGAKRSSLIAAKRDVEIARMRVDDQQARLRTEYSALLNGLVEQRKKIDYYEKEANPQAEEIKRLAKISYELGEIGYLEYVQNVETALNTQLSYLECVNQYNLSLIKLLTLKGQI